MAQERGFVSMPFAASLERSPFFNLAGALGLVRAIDLTLFGSMGEAEVPLTPVTPPMAMLERWRDFELAAALGSRVAT